MVQKGRHKDHYFVLVLILVMGILGLKAAYPYRTLQAAILVLVAVLYVIWGVIHHRENHSLNSKIVIEYILIAALGLAALLFFIAGAFFI